MVPHSIIKLSASRMAIGSVRHHPDGHGRDAVDFAEQRREAAHAKWHAGAKVMPDVNGHLAPSSERGRIPVRYRDTTHKLGGPD